MQRYGSLGLLKVRELHQLREQNARLELLMVDLLRVSAMDAHGKQSPIGSSAPEDR